MAKRIRILTIRTYPNPKDFECIEVDNYNKREYLYWRLVDDTAGMEACFPVPVEFVKEKFAEQGRVYRETGSEFWKSY